MSLVIALVSVLTVAVPTIKNALVKKRADPVVSFVGPSEDGLSFVAAISNAGDEAMIIHSAGIARPGSTTFTMGTNVVLENDVQRIVKPGEIVLAHFSPWHDDVMYEGMVKEVRTYAKSGCTLLVNMSDLRGNAISRPQKVDGMMCDIIMGLVQASFGELRSKNAPSMEASIVEQFGKH